MQININPSELRKKSCVTICPEKSDVPVITIIENLYIKRVDNCGNPILLDLSLFIIYINIMNWQGQ